MSFNHFLFLFLAFFAGLILLKTDLLRSAPVSFSSGGAQVNWATATPGVTAVLPIAASYNVYDSKDAGITAGTDIKLASIGYTAAQTSDAGVEDTCTSASCAITGGFNAGTKTNTEVTGTGASASVVLAGKAGLVGLWHLNEATSGNVPTTAGYVTDASGSGNAGTFSNANVSVSPTTAYAAGKLGGAITFDGVDDYVNLGDPAAVDFGTGDFTFASWIKLNSIAAEDMILGKDISGNRQFNFEANIDIGGTFQPGRLSISFYVPSAGTFRYQETGNNVIDTNWHHVVGLRRGASLEIWMDGVQQATTGTNPSAVEAMNAAASNLNIGRRDFVGEGDYFDGRIDEVGIYNRALTATEISDLYNSGAGRELPYKASGSFESAALNLGSTNYAMDAIAFNAAVPTAAQGAGALVPANMSGLVGLWHLDGIDGAAVSTTAGAITDSQTNVAANNGTFSNVNASAAPTTTYAAGRLNTAINFDGVDDAVNISGTTVYAASTAPFTASAWVNLTDFTGESYRNIVMLRTDTAAAWHILLSNNVSYQGISIGSNATWTTLKTDTNPASLTGSWHHVAVTYNGGGAGIAANFKIYLDGVLQTLSAAGAYGDLTQATAIGKSSVNFWKGLIDEVAIFNRALSADEIKGLYQSSRLQMAASNCANGAANAPACTTTPGWGDADTPFVGPDGTVNTYFTQPAGLWHLNEGGSSAVTADASGNGNTGTLSIGASGTQISNVNAWSNGAGANAKLGGQAISFDGTDDYVNVGSGASLNITGAITLTGWIKTTASTTRTIVGKWDRALNAYYWLGNDSAVNGARFIISPGDYNLGTVLDSAFVINDDNWHHVAGVYQQGVFMGIYVDGVLRNSLVPTVVLGSGPSTAVTIGGAGLDNEFYFSGSIDEVGVYNRALTAGEVKALYNSGTGREGAVGNLAGTGFNNKQYLKYKAALGTADTTVTPQLDDIALAYSGYSSLAVLTSSKFDTGANNSFVKSIAWTEAGVTAAKDVKLKLSAAATSAGIGTFCGPRDGTDGSCTGSYFTDPLGTEEIDDVQIPGRWFQYHASLTSDGTGTATLDNINVTYDTVSFQLTSTGGGSVNAGTAYPITIKAMDTQAVPAPVTGWNGSKTLAFTGAATIGANAPKISDDNICGDADDMSLGAAILNFASGVADPPGAETNYYLCAYKAEAVTLSATASSAAIPTTTSLNVTVNALPPTSLAFTQQPASTGTAGAAFTTQAILLVADTYGNPRSGYWVDLTDVLASDNITTGAGVLNGAYSKQSDSAGLATFTNVGYTKTDTIHIKASVTTPALSAVSTTNITLSGGAAAIFTLSAPADIAAGKEAAYTVTRYDQFNNLTTSGIQTVYLSSNSTGNKVFRAVSGGASVTSIAIADGQSAAGFYYYDDKVGSWVITASDAAVPDGVTGIDDAADTLGVTPGQTTQIVFTTLSQSVGAGVVSGVMTVQARDAYGNVDTSNISSVSLTSTSATMKFDTSAGGSFDGTITAVTLAAGEKSFYFKDTTSSTTATITASLPQANILQTSDTGTGDTPNAGGFNAGAKTNAAVSGTGSAAKITLASDMTPGDNIATGANPFSVAYDPTQNAVWVANYGAATLQKFNASTGAQIGSNITTGSAPFSVAYDPTQNAVWVVNSGSNTLQKFNASTGAQIGANITTGSSPYSVAYDVTQNAVWVSNLNSNTLQKFNASTGAQIGADITTGTNPRGVAYDPTQNAVWVVNATSNTLQKFNASTGAQIGADITTGTTPRIVVYDSTQNAVWVSNYGSNTLQKFNASTGAQIGANIATGSSPFSVAYDPTQNTVWVANRAATNTLQKFNASTGAQIGSNITTGTDPCGVAYDPTRNAVWVVNFGSNTLQKFKASDGLSYHTAKSIATGTNPRDVAYDSTQNAVWVVNYASNTLQKFDASTGVQIGANITTATNPIGVAYDPTQNAVWVVNFTSNTLQKFNAVTGAQIGTNITTGTGLRGVAYDPTQNAVWVVNFTSNTLQKFNAVTGAQIGTNITTGTGPRDVAYDPTQNAVWVVNYTSNTLQKFNASTEVQIGGNITTGTNPHDVAYDPAQNAVWVTNVGSNTLQKFNASTGAQIGANITTGSTPRAVIYDSTRNAVWVANYGTNILQKFNAATGSQIGANITAGTNPENVAYDSVQNAVWVSNYGSNTLTQIKMPYLTPGTFESATLDLGGPQDLGALTWNPGAQPAGTNLQVQVAANNDNATWNYTDLNQETYPAGVTVHTSYIRPAGDCTGYSPCYNSLSAWEAAQNRDLTALNEIEVAKIDGAWTAADTTAVVIDGWTTDATHYIKIFTTSAARHSGKWDNSKYRLESSTVDYDGIIRILENYIKIEGLQIKLTGTNNTGPRYGMIINNSDNTNNADIKIGKNIIVDAGSGSAQRVGINLIWGGGYVYNNLIYDFGSTGIDMPWYNASSFYIYNNTVYGGAGAGISRLGNSSVYLKNNIASSNAGGDYTGTFTTAANNISSDATSPNGLTYQNKTVAFVNTVNRDLHLASTDTAAKNAGTDLSADANLPFNTDIEGHLRTTAGLWDIGASEYGASGGNILLPAGAQEFTGTESGLVGLWHMNNAWTDASANGNNGTAAGGAAFSTSAKLGSHAGSFDGVDDYVALASVPINNTAQYTISLWMNTTQSAAKGSVYHEGGTGSRNIQINVNETANKLKFVHRGTSIDFVTSATTVNNGNWYHVVGTRDSAGTISLYINGAFEGSNVLSGDGVISSTQVKLGSAIAGGEFYSGLLDEVAIFNRALTATEIKAMYDNTYSRYLRYKASFSTADTSVTPRLDDVTIGYVSASGQANTVTPAAAATLTVSGITDPVAAGTPASVTVTAKDQYGNTATGYTGTVTFTSNDTQAVLPANYTFLAGDNGVKIFTNGVTMKTVGERTVTATDTVTGTITGTQSAITVNPAAAATLTVSGITDPVAAGTPASVTVTAKDAYGNTATGYLGTVTFTSDDTQAVVPANYTFLAGDNGVKIFTNGVTLKTSGEKTVTATDTVTGTITGTQTAITVNAAAATTLTVSGITDPVAAGTPSNVTVTAKDQYGNTATGYTGTVTFTSNDTQAVVPANYTFLAGDNGVKTFTSGVTMKTVGERTVTATDTVTGTITGTQSAITVTPGPTTQIVFTTLSQSVGAGVVSGVMTVQARDAYGNVDTNNISSVSLVSTSSTMKFDTSSGGAFDGTITAVTLAAGEKSFYFKDTTSSTTATITASLAQANILQTSDTGTGDTPNVGGFNAGTKTGTAVSGTGVTSSVKLSNAAHINEYTIGALANIPVTVSAVSANPSGGWVVTLGATNLSRIFKNDRFTDSATKNWKILSVFDSADKIIVIDSEGNGGTPATGAGNVGRWFATLQAWEDARQGDLIARNAVEKGLAYNDGVFTTGVSFSGSTTDATRYMWLTAAPTERHRGIAGTGVRIDADIDDRIIGINDEYTVVEWLDIKNFNAGAGRMGMYISSGSSYSTIRNNIVHGCSNSGITMNSGGWPQAGIKIHNNIVYNNAGYGIWNEQFSDILEYFNNTVYNNNMVGIDGPAVMKNNISVNNGGVNFQGISAGSDYNISSDATATGVSSLINQTLSQVAFKSTMAGSEDLRLEFNSVAKNAGADLSTTFTTDIDGDTRTAPWDIGADDVGATLVKVHSIGTAGRDFATLQGWETARNGVLTTRRVFKTTGQTGAFTAGSTLKACASGATGTYIPERDTPSASETYMTLDNVIGTFSASYNVMVSTDSCVSPTGPVAVISSVLTTAGTIERGEAYKDSAFTTVGSTAIVTIDGSATDATHYMHLTVPSSDRHNGTSDKGTTVLGAYDGFNLSDNYSIVEWFVIKNHGGGSTEKGGLEVGGSINNCIVRNNVVDGGAAPDVNASGIVVGGNSNSIYNNIVLNLTSATRGRGIVNPTSADSNLYYNNIVYNTRLGFDFTDVVTDGSARNNISAGNVTNYQGVFHASSSNNISSDATAPGAGSLINKAVADLKFVSTAAGIEDFHIMGGSVAQDAGADLSATFKDDADGHARPNGSAYDIGSDEWYSSSPFYSGSGTFESATLDLGGPQDLGTISWNPGAQPAGTNLYVQLAANNDNATWNYTDLNQEAYPSGVTVHTSYIRPTGDCTGYSPCYNSLSAWEAAQNRDLTALNEIEVAKIDGAWTVADTTAVTIDGWTTDATHYIKIYTTSAARHAGKWDTGKYRLEVTGTVDAISNFEDFVRIEGLQVRAGNFRGFRDMGSVSSGKINISHNIIKGSGSSTYGIVGSSATYQVWNNIIYNFAYGYSDGNSSASTVYLYNNTISNCTTNGVHGNGIRTYKLRNNLAVSNTAGDFLITSGAIKDVAYNASSDATADDWAGVGNKINQTVAFVDAANGDFRLASSDTAAKNAGADLSADANLPVTTDIEGHLRTGPSTGSGFDIGASEYGATGGNIPTSLDNNRYLRYKASFSTADTSVTPQLDDVTIGYVSSSGQANTITPAAASYFTVTSATATPAAGTPFNVTLTARDSFGNIATGYSAAAKTFTLSGPGNAPIGTAPAYGTNASIIAAFASGVATIPITLYKAETVSLDVSDGTLDSTGSAAYDADLTVGQAAAAQLAFSVQPSAAVTAGVDFAQQPVVQIQDQYGNLRTADTNAITLSAVLASDGTTPGGGTFGVTTNPLSATAGAAAFAGVNYTKTESIKLKAVSGALTAALSNAITVNPAAASAVNSTISAVPSVLVGANAAVTVTARDAFNNLIPSLAITFTATGTENTLPGATTNAGGVATMNFSSTMPEEKLVSSSITGAQTAAVSVRGMKITAPASGAVWAAGSTQTISWVINLATAPFTVQYWNGTGWFDVRDAANVPAVAVGGTTQQWKVPVNMTISSTAKVKVFDNDVPGEPFESGLFSISGGLTLSQPAAGGKWAIGTAHNIEWTEFGTFGSGVKLEYYDGAIWKPVTGGGADNAGIAGTLFSTNPDGSLTKRFSWTPSSETGLTAGYTTANIRVSDANTSNPPVSAASGNFTIAGMTVNYTPPDRGNTAARAGATGQTISWTHAGAGFVKLQYYSPSGAGYADISGATALAAGASGGSFAWTVPDDVGVGNVLLKAIAVGADGTEAASAIEGSVSDVLNTAFTIYGTLTMSGTYNGTAYSVDSAASRVPVTWSGSSSIPSVVFEYTTSNTTPVYTVITSVQGDFYTTSTGTTVGYNWAAGTGSAYWQPKVTGSTFWLRLKDGADSQTVSALLSAANYFGVSGVSVNSVVPASPFTAGQAVTVNGAGAGAVTVGVFYAGSLADAQNKTGTIGSIGVATVAGDDTFTIPWTVPDLIGNTVYLRVENTANTSVFNVAGPYTITGKVTITNPAVTDWVVGDTTHDIAGTVTGDIDSITLQYTTAAVPVETDWINLTPAAVGIGDHFGTTASAWTLTDAFTVPDVISASFKLRAIDGTILRAASLLAKSAAITNTVATHGALTVSTPGAAWVVSAPATVNWTAKGSLGNIIIEYQTSTDNNLDPWSTFATVMASTASGGAGTTAVAGSYVWNSVADAVAAEVGAGVQSDPDVFMRVKVRDLDDPAVSATTTAFAVKYRAITWRILDANGNPVTGLNVGEAATTNPVKPAFNVADNTFSGNNTIRYYPDNAGAGEDPYTTLFDRTEAGTVYSTSSAGWVADADKIITLTMDTAATAAISYTTEINAVYDATNDAIAISSWLTKKGVQVSTLTSLNSSISVNIYDTNGTQLNTSDLGTGKTPNAQGIYSGIVYDPAGGLDPSQTYTIRATISYNSAQYTGVSGFVSPSVFSYTARIGAIYNTANDSIVANTWLERSGTTVTDPGDMTFQVLNSAGTVLTTPASNYMFDGYDSTTDTIKDAKLISGVYTNIEYDPIGGLSATEIYTIKADIVYRGRTYNAVASFSKGELGTIASDIQAVQTAQTAQTTTLQSSITGQTATLQGSITGQTTTLQGSITGQTTTLQGSIANQTTTLGNQIGSVGANVTALPGTVSSAVTTAVTSGMNAELAKGVQAELLTRPTNVVSGTTIPIRYRTATGLSPKITVYDAGNVVRVGGEAMKEISTTGIYEYKLTLNTAWGTGDFTVLVMESTRGSTDSLILHVGLGGLDEIYSSVSSLSTTTTSSSNVTLDKIFTGVTAVQTNTNGLNQDVTALLLRLGKTTDGAGVNTLFGKIAAIDTSGGNEEAILAGVAEIKSYVDSLEGSLGASTDKTASGTIFGRLADIEDMMTNLGTSSKEVESAKAKAAALAALMQEIRADLAGGDMTEAGAKLAALGQGLSALNNDLNGLPAAAGEASIGSAFENIKTLASGGGMEGLVPLLEEIKKEREAFNPENMTQMRNTVEELKSLMTEVRALLDQEVNKPVVHGWLEEEQE